METHFYFTFCTARGSHILFPVAAVTHVSKSHQFSLKMYDLSSLQITVSLSTLLDSLFYISLVLLGH